MKYPVSVWIDYYEEKPVEEAIALLAKAGFTQGELSIVHLEQLMEKGDPVATGKALRACADSYGYAIPQGHLSFREQRGLPAGLTEDGALERLKPELDLFAAAGISKAVLHLGGGAELPEEERYRRWVRNVSILSQYVEGTGVTLCLENLPGIAPTRTAESLLKFISDAGDKNLAICLDTGHLHLTNVRGDTAQTHGDFIRTAGNYLQALHIVDNNGEKDTHQMPFSARTGVDWVDVMKGLRDIEYKGLFNLEILGERGGNPAIKAAKLAFIKTMCEEMLSPAFLTE